MRTTYIIAGLTLLIGLITAESASGQDTIPEQKKTAERIETGRKMRMGRKSSLKEQTAQDQKQHFVDLDGDGYNDNAPDHDGDGIPNRLDPDWKKLKRKQRQPFIDLDGDGINDNLQEGGDAAAQQLQLRAGQESGSSLETGTETAGKQKQKRKGGN